MRSTAIIAPLLLLAGCGSSDQMKPGQWVSEATLESLQAPQMAPEAAQQMKRVMGRAVSGQTLCLTEEMIDRPPADFFGGTDSGCDYQQFNMEGGKIDGMMRCTQGARVQFVDLQGTYSADRYDMRMYQKIDAGTANEMQMVVKVTARRTGNCKAS